MNYYVESPDGVVEILVDLVDLNCSVNITDIDWNVSRSLWISWI